MIWKTRFATVDCFHFAMLTLPCNLGAGSYADSPNDGGDRDRGVVQRNSSDGQESIIKRLQARSTHVATYLALKYKAPAGA